MLRTAGGLSLFPSNAERRNLGRVALGIDPPDTILGGGSYLNVFTREVVRGDIWISGRYIAKITSAPCPHDSTVVDVTGKVLTPGFVEGHIHAESSLVDPPHFAEAALRCGATSVVTDFHEVGAIAGVSGIREMLAALESTPVKAFYMTPIRLPFLPEIQRTLSTLEPVEALELLGEARTVGLSEVNGRKIVESLRDGRASDFALFTHATVDRRTPEGHLFFIRGDELDACLAVGVSSDHEPRRQDEVAEKVRKGLFVMLRNGTLAREVETLVEVVAREHLPPDRIGLVTDDIMVSDMTVDTYMLHKVRTAVDRGVATVDALRMVSYNVADHYRLGELVGALRPGAFADILVFDSLESLSLEAVYSSGAQFSAGSVESTAVTSYSDAILTTCTRSPITTADLTYLPEGFAERSVTIRAMELDETTRFTSLVDVEVPVREGEITFHGSEENLFFVVCANRRYDELVGRAFLRNYGLREGAVAVSLAHDHHGIVALGRTKDDLCVAANRVMSLQGGIVVVRDGEVVVELALPVAGLMSSLPVDETVGRIREIEAYLRGNGVAWRQPIFFLFWLGMEVAPYYRISDRGLFDTEAERIVPCVAASTDG